MAAHSASALHQGLAPEHVETLRNGQALAAPRLEVLRRCTQQMTEQRGHLTAEQEAAFHDAGFSRHKCWRLRSTWPISP